MGLKKTTKKRFSLIESILMKNAANRIEDLEDKTNALEEKITRYETVIEDFSTAADEIDGIKSAVRRIVNEIGKKDSEINTPSGNTSELLDQQKRYIDSRIDDIKKNQLTYDSVDRMIRDNNNEIRKEIKIQTGTAADAKPAVVDVDYNRINQQIMFSVRQAFESDNRIAYLNNLLNAEIEKNNRLEKTLAELYARIEKLEKQEAMSVTVHATAADKLQVPVDTNEIKVSEIDNTPDVSGRHIPLFVLSSSQNMHKLEKVIEAAMELKEQYNAVLSDDAGNSVYFKTADNLVKKLNKLADKCSDDESEPSSVAGELVKIINATVVKNFANLKLSDVIDKFLIRCGMEKRILDVGKKLSDDDLELIGDMPLDIPVQTAEQHNTIIQKTHDAYIIYYKDEDGLSYRIISGQYSIGKFVR